MDIVDAQFLKERVEHVTQHAAELKDMTNDLAKYPYLFDVAAFQKDIEKTIIQINEALKEVVGTYARWLSTKSDK